MRFDTSALRSWSHRLTARYRPFKARFGVRLPVGLLRYTVSMPKPLNQTQFRTDEPEQLKLFMSGTEWQNYTDSSIDGGPVDGGNSEKATARMKELWSTKEKEARAPFRSDVHGAGTYDSMKERGYDPSPGEDPPTIILMNNQANTHVVKMQSEGHHRVAAAAAIERDTGQPVWMPVTYADATPAGRARRAQAAAPAAPQQAPAANPFAAAPPMKKKKK